MMRWKPYVIPEQPERPKWLRYVLLAYGLIVAFGLKVHVPWSDEADPWLMAAHGTLHDYLNYPSYTGHPPFWLGLLTVMARLGLPFGSMQVLNGVLSVVTAWVILYRAPFAAWLRVGILCTFTMLFQYSVVSRGYMLMTLMVMLTAVMYPKREEKPKLYGLTLALLFHTEVFVMVPASLLILQFAWERRRSDWTGAVIAIVGALMSVGWLLPWDGLSNMQHLYRMENVFFEGFWLNLARAFVGMPFLQMAMPYVGKHRFDEWIMVLPRAMVGIWVMVELWRAISGRVRYLMAAWLLGLYLIFTFVYRGQVWHAQTFIVFTVWTLWMCHNEGVRLRRQARLGWALVVTVVLGFVCAFLSHLVQFNVPYSGGRGMANYILKNGYEGKSIVTLLCYRNDAVAAYLPNNKFWFTGQKRYSNYVLWGNFHDTCQRQSNQVTPELLEFAKKKPVPVLVFGRVIFPKELAVEVLHDSHGLVESYQLYLVRAKEPAAPGE